MSSQRRKEMEVAAAMLASPLSPATTRRLFADQIVALSMLGMPAPAIANAIRPRAASPIHVDQVRRVIRDAARHAGALSRQVEASHDEISRRARAAIAAASAASSSLSVHCFADEMQALALCGAPASVIATSLRGLAGLEVPVEQVRRVIRSAPSPAGDLSREAIAAREQAMRQAIEAIGAHQSPLCDTTPRQIQVAAPSEPITRKAVVEALTALARSRAEQAGWSTVAEEMSAVLSSLSREVGPSTVRMRWGQEKNNQKTKGAQ